MMALLLTVALVMTSWTAVEASYFHDFTHDCFEPDHDPLEKNSVQGTLIPDDDHDDDAYGHKSVCTGDKYALTEFKINITDYHGETQEETCVVKPLKSHVTFVVCNLETCDTNKHAQYYSRVETRCVPTVQPVFIQALCVAADHSSGTTTVSPMTTPMMRKKRSIHHASGLFRGQFDEPFFNKQDFPDFGQGGGYGAPHKPRKTTTPGPPKPRYRSVTLDLPTFCSCKFFDC